MAERGARERCGVGVRGVGDPKCSRIKTFNFFFAFDAKSCVVGSKTKGSKVISFNYLYCDG